MKDKQASLTALFTAYFRAYHAMHHDPKIFDDHLAYRLLTSEEITNIERILAGALKVYDPEKAASCPDQATALAEVIRIVTGLVPSRSRYAEDKLEEAVRQGVQQYVILGAGMDTFAFRRKQTFTKLQVFKIDHPVMQDYKRRRLAEVGWEVPPKLHFIPADFTQENLITALTRATSYDTQALTFFSWLGVTYYLPSSAVFATLRDIVKIAAAGSSIIFDYNHSDVFNPERTSKRLQLDMEYFRSIGEPIVTGFQPFELAKDLAQLGLSLHENLDPNDIDERFFKNRTDGYQATEHIHLAQVVVR